MSVVNFEGGPLDGQSGLYPPDEGAGGPPPEEASAPEDESSLFTQMLSSARTLLSSGSLSEQNKLLMEQATTLIQKIKASEEKEMNDAMSGKMSPGVLRKVAGGGGY